MTKAIKWSWALMVLIVLPLMFNACGDDKDDEETLDESYDKMIVGTWSDEDNDSWYENGVGTAYGFVFKENGTCYIHGSSFGTGRYEIVNNKLLITFVDQFDDQYQEIFTIKSITKNVLIILDSDYDEEVYYRVK